MDLSKMSVEELEAWVDEAASFRYGAGMKEFARRLAAMQSIVERLPKTAEGVVVLPGDTLYKPHHDGYVEEYSVGRSWEKQDTTSRPLPAYVYERWCYSSWEAAQAARNAGEVGDE